MPPALCLCGRDGAALTPVAEAAAPRQHPLLPPPPQGVGEADLAHAAELTQGFSGRELAKFMASVQVGGGGWCGAGRAGVHA